MIVDFWTKTGSHYRADDAAQTLECIGPNPFAPHKVALAVPPIPDIAVGQRMRAVWVDGGPYGKASISTSDVVRVEIAS